MEDLVSIVVPVYNVEKYLKKSIESILNQTYQNIEILLVDDGSTDSSGKICESFSKVDPRIRVFHKENGGLSDARNFGIEQMKGQYVAFIDSDDYISKDYVWKLYSSIKNNDSEVSICSFLLVDEKGEKIKDELLDSGKICLTGQQILEKVLTADGYRYVVAWNKLYRSTLFEKLKFKKGMLYEDEFLNYPLFWDCKRVSIVEEPLYLYVQRKGSIVQSNMTLEKIKMKDEMHTSRIEFYSEKGHSFLHEKACQQYCNWIVTTTTNNSKILNTNFYKYLQRQFRKFAKYTRNNDIRLIVQNILGFIDIRLAAYVKSKVM
ncbi:ss-1,4-galactosyltransferase [Streptococcus pneumoniae]|nr:glycosyltransferase [Streptococcus pneumoniae]MDS6131986.1 glycosyltransferase [Streptococcus pneumoniae]MDT5976999.1 glycosyltransferase [Streptococcus pneumoniae]VJD48308.1 ss-1,4-galactosyltransferase [Streptococcus pneumoniae]VJW08763.1 ss-1,4-galactosyltransferase [Streptococcus pneumoniae]